MLRFHCCTVVPEPQAALGQATLLGLRRNIPQDLNEAFRRTGTAHLLAISGLHVGILLGISLAASAALLGRKHHLHLIAPLLVIWLYGLLSGMSPSATRACIMGSVYLASLAFGRQREVACANWCRCRADGCRVAIHLVQHIVSAKFRGDSRHSGVFGCLRGRAEVAYRAAYRAAIPTTRATCRDYGYAGAVACSYYNDSAVNCVSLRTGVHAGHTGFCADAARATVSHSRKRGCGASRLGERCVRYAVRLGGMGRWGVSIRSGYALGRAAGGFGGDWQVVGLPVVIAFYGVLILAYGAKVMFPGTVRGFLRGMAVGGVVRQSHHEWLGVLSMLRKCPAPGASLCGCLCPPRLWRLLVWSQALTERRPPACDVLRCRSRRCDIHRDSGWPAGGR